MSPESFTDGVAVLAASGVPPLRPHPAAEAAAAIKLSRRKSLLESVCIALCLRATTSLGAEEYRFRSALRTAVKG
jgi:hypothetical protein